MHFSVATLLTAASIFAGTALASPSAAAEPPTRASVHERASKASVAPGCWSGTNFPPKAAWSPFPDSYAIAKDVMTGYANDTKSEVKAIRHAIKDAAAASGFDERFILAIMRRESDGQTTIPCNDNGKSCGLMQVQGTDVPHCTHHPCPAKKIHKMIHCGVLGCGGASIANCASVYGAHNYAAIARCYNSGQVVNPDDYTRTGDFGVRTYVQDVGNLLLATDYPTWSAFDNGVCGYHNAPA